MTVKEYNKSVREYGDHVYRFIYRSLKDSGRAADVVQDTYEKLWRGVAEVEYDCAKQWLFTTAYNRMIDVIRKDSRLVAVEYYDDSSLYAEENRSDLNEILHKALEKLPPAMRSVILLRDYEGYSYKEIGSITGLTEAQVKINIFRGRAAMRNYLVKTAVWQ